MTTVVVVDLLVALRHHPLLAEPWGNFGPIEVLDMRANERGAPAFAGVLNHHTVSNANSGAYPSKSICRNGRGGAHPVPGPLCNILGARGGGSIGVISSRVANHAGLGDPDVLRRVRAGQPPKPRPGPDQSNAGGGPGFIGIEWENNGTGEPWSPRMVDTIVRVNAALCDIGRWDPAVACLGHLEWTRRKIDPAFHTPAMTMGDLRRDITACLDAWRHGTTPLPPKDDEMTPAQEAKLDALAADVAALTANVNTLATGGTYQGHAWPGLIQSIGAIRKHLGDDTKTVRGLLEAIRNRVGRDAVA